MFNFLNPFFLITQTTFYGFFDSLLPVAGGAVGFALGGPVGAAIGAGIGGSVASAGSQEDIARAQQEAAREGIQFQTSSRQAALDIAQPSPDELPGISKLMQNRDEILSRNRRLINDQQEILDAVNPAIKQAGAEALRLLQGQEAESLSFVRSDREKKRTALEQTLAARLGAGFETSTAGIQALNAFDDTTSRTLFDAQQVSLNQFLGVSERAGQAAVGNIANLSDLGIRATAAPLAAQGNIKGRQINAISGNKVDFNPLVRTAGAEFTSEAAIGQTLEGLLGAGVNIAAFKAGAAGGNNQQQPFRGDNTPGFGFSNVNFFPQRQ